MPFIATHGDCERTQRSLSYDDLPSRVDVAIIGAGIVGLATGLEFIMRAPGITLAILEKEPRIAGHQSSHNSGVIHSGIYYKPGSHKAKLCVEGAEALLRFCKDHGVAHEICGKLIIATRVEELPRLAELYKKAQQNGLKGVQELSAEQIPEYEPNAAGIRALHVAGTGIVDYAAVAQKYAELIVSNGGTIHLSREVSGIRRSNGSTVIETNGGSMEATLVVNCAGLHSDRIARLTDPTLDLRIVPFRGEYYDLAPSKEHCIRGLLYPVPDPAFPFLGVHFTRRIGGGIEAGPNAVLALAREGYSKTSLRMSDVLGYASFPGFWKMAARNWRMSVEEYHRSFSKQAFLQGLQRLMPSLRMEDLAPGGSGVRAQALDRSGKLIDDFRFVQSEGTIHVCNAPSPAATASLVIGRYIVDTAIAHHGERLRRVRVNVQ